MKSARAPAAECCFRNSEVLCDGGKQDLSPVSGVATPDEFTVDESTPGAVVCPVTGAVIDQPRPGQRFVSAVVLRNDDDLLLTLERQHRQYAKGSKEDLFSRAAHNVRNKESNERNNLRRRIDRFNKKKGGQQSLFPELDVFPFTDAQRAALDYWNGTPYEVTLHDS